MDNIISAMKGHRIFERFGFNLPKLAEANESIYTRLNQYQEWKFDLAQCDWVDNETDSILSGYIHSPELIDILEKNIDLVLE